jgi:nucleotide-binding universal stress UspA family protein
MLMSYKDLLVVLDSAAPTRGRIGLAAALAERFAAHLTGLYPLPIPQRPRELGYFDPGMLDPFFAEVRERARDAADKVREQFEHVTKLRGVSAEWRLIPRARKRIRRCTPAMPI